MKFNPKVTLLSEPALVFQLLTALLSKELIEFLSRLLISARVNGFIEVLIWSAAISKANAEPN